MANQSDDLRYQVAPLETIVKTLLNSDLKELCRSEGLPVSGVKASLQIRVLDRMWMSSTARMSIC